MFTSYRQLMFGTSKSDGRLCSVQLDTERTICNFYYFWLELSITLNRGDRLGNLTKK